MRVLFIILFLVFIIKGHTQEPPPLPVVETPVSVKNPVKYDSSYFIITVLVEGFKISLLDTTSIVSTAKEVDAFIVENKKRIDAKKILLMGNHDASYQQFQPIIEIFKKHEYLRFKMVTLPPSLVTDQQH